MRILIEVEGTLLDTREALYHAHREAAAGVHWAPVDQATFRRRLRKEGPQAPILRGAPAAKLAAYTKRFLENLYAPAFVDRSPPAADARDNLQILARQGAVIGLTMTSGLDHLQNRLGPSLLQHLEEVVPVNPDPRKRPAEFTVLAGDDQRTLVVASGESILRAATPADLVAVGVSSGACHADRLYQAGAATVFQNLAALTESLRDGGTVLVRAGLLPPGA